MVQLPWYRGDRLPGSTISVFSEPDDYQAALRSDGGFDRFVEGRGEFSAQLTRVELPRMHLMAGAEHLARIAFVSQPNRFVRISLPLRGSVPVFRNGIPTRADEIMTHGQGQPMHERTEGPCCWRTIGLPVPDLIRYGRAIIGAGFQVPLGTCRWRPPRAALRQLIRLHDDATRMSRVQPSVVTAAEATRGLQQELIDGLLECMQMTPINEVAASRARHVDIMDRFEDLLRDFPDRPPSVVEICAKLEVPDRVLRLCCNEYLGMGPHRYLHLRQLHFARRALRYSLPGVARNRMSLAGMGLAAQAASRQLIASNSVSCLR